MKEEEGGLDRRDCHFEQSDQKGRPKKVSCKPVSREGEGGILVDVCTMASQAEGGAFQAEGGASARLRPPRKQEGKGDREETGRGMAGDRGVGVI